MVIVDGAGIRGGGAASAIAVDLADAAGDGDGEKKGYYVSNGGKGTHVAL